jgi:hypothetical protein
VDWSDWLLFFHVAAAFSLVVAYVLFWTMAIVGVRSASSIGGLVPSILDRPANVLVAAGSLLTLVLGVWLAIDEYELWDGWIVASILLWAVGVETGRRAGVQFTRAMAGDPAAAELRRRGLILHSASTVAILLVLVLMIFKPGA